MPSVVYLPLQCHKEYFLPLKIPCDSPIQPPSILLLFFNSTFLYPTIIFLLKYFTYKGDL